MIAVVFLESLPSNMTQNTFAANVFWNFHGDGEQSDIRGRKKNSSYSVDPTKSDNEVVNPNIYSIIK